jgi:cyclohexanone monooxygenase
MTTTTLVDHLVIGSGFAGLAAAVQLDGDGERDFVVVEKGSDVGGTWRDNTYPGAACDVPSQLYSFSFAPNPDWSMSFSPQPEILAYLQRVAREAGVLDRFVFDTTVDAATWDAGQERWVVEVSGPAGATTYAARTLLSGAGGLSEPKLPDIEGIETFQGEVFHSARWDHSVDLAGKRVAVIGTGASAIQIVPELQEVVGHLDLYQRTAPYVLPRHDRRYSALEKLALKHVPGLQKLYRTAIYWGRETYVPAFTLQPKIAAPAKKMALDNLRKAVKDPVLREKLTPTFEIGCKRILISNRYYPAVASDNVELVTDRIAKITGSGIVTADGTEREVDALVVATGFHTTDIPIAHQITGRTGRTLAERFAEHGMSAYKGTTIPEFPNLFMMVGPNTGLGHSSMVFIIESQVAYIRDAIRTMRRNRLSTVEVREEPTAAFNAGLQRRMGRTVWTTGGCASWYLDSEGRNTTLWPRTTFTFRRLLSRFDLAAYTVTGETSPADPAPTTGTTGNREAVNA